MRTRLSTQSPRRDIATGIRQRIVPGVNGLRTEVHDSQNMLKSHVFGGWKHPPGSLQLMNLPHPLHPRVIDQILLGRLLRRQTDAGHERDVSVNGIVRQAFRNEVAGHERCVGNKVRGYCEQAGERQSALPGS